jgi:hypothetical protein
MSLVWGIFSRFVLHNLYSQIATKLEKEELHKTQKAEPKIINTQAG